MKAVARLSCFAFLPLNNYPIYSFTSEFTGWTSGMETTKKFHQWSRFESWPQQRQYSSIATGPPCLHYGYSIQYYFQNLLVNRTANLLNAFNGRVIRATNVQRTNARQYQHELLSSHRGSRWLMFKLGLHISNKCKNTRSKHSIPIKM